MPNLQEFLLPETSWLHCCAFKGVLANRKSFLKTGIGCPIFYDIPKSLFQLLMTPPVHVMFFVCVCADIYITMYILIFIYIYIYIYYRIFKYLVCRANALHASYFTVSTCHALFHATLTAAENEAETTACEHSSFTR